MPDTETAAPITSLSLTLDYPPPFREPAYRGGEADLEWWCDKERNDAEAKSLAVLLLTPPPRWERVLIHVVVVNKHAYREDLEAEDMRCAVDGLVNAGVIAKGCQPEFKFEYAKENKITHRMELTVTPM